MTDPIVQIQSGLVCGIVEKDEDGFEYYAFKGIPYAEPPIGELRFKDPIAIKKWNGVRDTRNISSACPQGDLSFHRITNTHEDCLYLHVYTKAINQRKAKKAVMVWIHGGAFIWGSADDILYGPEYLIRKDIVLVKLNYRLGVFGFLNLEHEIAPGNQGLKDQLMALRWIQQNIQEFGGDPDNVTVFGQSAGGSSAHYLTFSPLAKGLVHKAISQSGTAYNSWANFLNPKKYAIKLCHLLGKELKESRAIVEFLRTIDAQKLQDTQERLRVIEGRLPFGPGIDVKSSKPFMPISPDIAADEGVHVPFLVGHNKREGIFLMLEIHRDQILKTIDSNFDSIHVLGSERIAKRHNLNANQLRRLYYKSEKISDDNLDKYVDLMGDLQFTESVHKFVKVQAQRSSAATYMYQFSYDTSDSFTKLFISNRFEGSGHGDELKYLFKMRIYNEFKQDQLIKGTSSYKIMEQMTELWTNFAKYGKPTVTISELIPVHWLPVADGTLLRYMNIDENLTMQCALNIDQKYLSAKDIKV